MNPFTDKRAFVVLAEIGHEGFKTAIQHGHSLPRLCFDFSSNVQSIGFIDHIFQRQHDTAMKISGIRCIKLIRNSNEANIMSMEILFDIITCVNRISP